MKFRLIFLVIIISLFFCLSVTAQPKGIGNQTATKLPSKEKRWALIIGVDTYRKSISPLFGTVNDAKALRKVLIKHAGFTNERIILMTTDSNDPDLIPTRGNIIDQLNKLQRAVPEDGLVLFSFSGHGISIGNDAFIIPSDGRIYKNADLMRERAIDVLRIKRAIQATKVKQVIMFLDACRNDPLRAKGDVDNKLTKAYANGFSFEAKNQNIEAYATLYATSFGDRAYEFFDRKTNKYRGYFSYAIEEGLRGKATNKKGEVTLGSLIRYIEDTVKKRVRINENQRQIPYPISEGFRNSDLIISVNKRKEQTATNPVSGEAAFWREIENSKDISDFENYLKRVQNGEFKGVYKATAELKLFRLKKANAPKAWLKFSSIAKLLIKYDWVCPFSEGLARAGLNNKWGFIDKTGKEVIPIKYDWNLGCETDNYFSEGLAAVSINDKWGFINKAGKVVIPFKYDWASAFSEGLAPVKLNDKWGFINKSGNTIIPPKYELAESAFSEGLTAVKLDGKFGYIDRFGKLVIPFKYYRAKAFSEGLASVSLLDSKGNDKYGFINKSGEVVIPLKYEYAEKFSEGLAQVTLEIINGSFGKWGFIDKTGKVIIPFIYEVSDPFLVGLAEVGQGVFDTKGYIDKTGKEVIPLKYGLGWCDAFRKEGFIGVKLNGIKGKKGFVDIYGNEYFVF